MGKIVGEVHKNPCCTFEWIIPDCFSLWQEYGNEYQSPDFECGDATWCLGIIPRIKIRNYIPQAWMHIFLKKRKSECLIHTATFTLGMKNKNEKVQVTDKIQRVFGNGYTYGWNMLLKSEFLEERDNLVPENVVTVVCTLTIHPVSGKAAEPLKTGGSMKECTKANKNPQGKETEYEEKDGNRIPEGMSKVTDDLKNLFLNEHNCDVTLKLKDREFRAHRLILEARSSVFFSMFKHDTVERSSGVVDIPDCDPDAFQDFLLYVYSGRVEKMNSDNALSLYSVADKYGLDSLKAECVEYMKKEFTIDTFADVIALAVRHNELALIESSISFFTKNAKKIFMTVKWQSFIKENPTAANELNIKLLTALIPE